jgi:hypothetical protein
MPTTNNQRGKPTETFVRRMPFKRGVAGKPTMCMVEIEIDVDRLFAYLGQKAFLNRSQTSVALQGDILVRVREVQEQTNEPT